MINVVRAKYFGNIKIRYPGDRLVSIPKGTSILEASQIAKIPHQSVCGGKECGNSVTGFEKEVVYIYENTEPEIRAVLSNPIITEAIQLYIYRVTAKEIGLADFEVLGGGFVSNARYESAVIELDDIASLGDIRWGGRQDPKAKVGVRTRAGMDPHPEIYWQVKEEYKKLD